MKSQKFNKLLSRISYDKQALSEIYEEYYLKVKAHVHRRFGKLIDVEDITQEVFLKLMSLDRSGKKYIDYPTSWLYMVADNMVKDVLRSTQRSEELTDIIATPFSLDNSIMTVDIKNALAHLDEYSQKIIYLHIWEGYSLKEISHELQISYSNVRAKASRAYKTLKKYL